MLMQNIKISLIIAVLRCVFLSPGLLMKTSILLKSDATILDQKRTQS